MIKKLILNKQLSIGIILLLVLGAVLVFPTSASETVDSPFGEWKISIAAINPDGDQMPLSVINNMLGQLLSVSVGDQEVTDFIFTLTAKATGNGYDTCELDMSNAYFVADVGGTFYEGQTGESNIIMDLDGSFQPVFEMHTGDAMHSLPTGDYTLVFHLQEGDFRFRGMPDGEWQTSTSIPSASIVFSVVAEQHCYKCDGEGGVDSVTVSGSCPDGWVTGMSTSDCECYTDETTDSYGNWYDIGCSSDCYMQQECKQAVYEGWFCPGMNVNDVDWQFVRYNYDHKTVYRSSCCTPDYITCYKCDGNGGVTSQQFTGSCGSGWSSSPPNCACYDEGPTYGPWGDYIFQYCIGATRYDRRERDVFHRTCCPGGSCTLWAKTGTDAQWMHYADAIKCYYGGQIVVPSLTFNVETTPFNSYQTDSSHYLGKI